ncbi:3-hydroxyacyl-CoA dehydrogenase family protein [Haliangium ochraceum]|uniref:3-hydroxybutyryl-CoA dehydrogenase n=1 Tax=Haliangium ochraceum (strain DSM 14365 / JCM 11303 / SMP-2) TaxID=502025 RepID=D0LYD0_HALO1|nr:3-hydroxyacyl-CoA dehydrogenase NAD-binding domain-containing protein [Haliangium ochraceum]ACY16280.1 3-hydroxybutyryl-CoA dehydrogenase [Haliangium ochraceum DSM 14365]
MAEANEIKLLGVVGAGQMGRGIAQVAALAGIEVLILDENAELAQAAINKIDNTMVKLVDKGKLDASAHESAVGRLAAAAAIKPLSRCDMIIEAVPEDLAIKRELFTKLDRDTGAILATNTSSISITKIAAMTSRPQQVIGMHFMNPVPRMKLVEVIRGLATDDATYATTMALAKKLGKTTVTSRDVPGFIVNRILIPLLNEACFALYEGLGTAADIDTGVELGLNHPMGPLTLADFIGLDTCLSIAEVLHGELGDPKYRPCPLLRQYVDAGWLGRKSGRGFYRYDEAGKKLADGAA